MRPNIRIEENGEQGDSLYRQARLVLRILPPSSRGG